MIVKTIPLGNEEEVTEYTDIAGTEATTFYYPVQQRHILLENQGNKSITFTINGVSRTIAAGKKWSGEVDFTSFYLVSEAGAQSFFVRSAAKAKEPNPVTFRELTEPFVIAHRGGANVYPENTMEAYKAIVAAGIRVIEQDVQTLSDGALAVMHDSSVDRLTTSTGNVADYTSFTWQNLVVDAPVWFTPASVNTKPVLFEDVLREFGNTVIYAPESKDQKSTAAIVTALKRHNLEDYALVQSFTLADLKPAVDAGIPTLHLTDTATPQSLIDAGVKYVGVSTSATDSYVQNLITAGLKPIVWTIDTRFDRDTWITKGVCGYFSNDPLWISGLNTHRRTTDPFKHLTFYHGHISTGHRGGYIANRWGWTVNTNIDYVLQGWGSPVPNPQSYQINYTMTVEVLNGSNDTTRWGSCAFASPIDLFADTGNTNSNAYHLILRANGIMVLYKIVNGASTQLGTVTVPAVAVGASATIRIDVTPTTVTITRTDVAAPNSITVSDTTFRGGYFFLNHSGIGVTYSNVTVS